MIDDEIIGADIAVNQTGIMHFAENIEHRREPFDSLLGGKIAVFLEIFEECFAVDILHDDIGGAVHFKVIACVDDMRLAVELCECARLGEKALHAFLEGCFHGAVGQGDLIGIVFGTADGIGSRKELFDCDPDIELLIFSGVGDAEAACAEDIADEVAVTEDGTGLEELRE